VTQPDSNDEPIQGQVVPEGGDPFGGDPFGGLLGGGIDVGSMLEMASNMQQQMAEAQEQLLHARVEGTAGGGLVTVTLNGHLHLVGVQVSPDAVDPDDLSMLEDLIRAAWQDAHDQVARLQADSMPMGGMGGPGGFPGLG
jgi:DNA-binding YbaB/EbfC family protein